MGLASTHSQTCLKSVSWISCLIGGIRRECFRRYEGKTPLYFKIPSHMVEALTVFVCFFVISL